MHVGDLLYQGSPFMLFAWCTAEIPLDRKKLTVIQNPCTATWREREEQKREREDVWDKG